MTDREMQNAPNLAGWLMAAAAGVVAFGAAVVAGGMALMGAAFIAAAVFVVVGLILGMPWGGARVQFAANAGPAVPVAVPHAPARLAFVAAPPTVAPVTNTAPVAAPGPAVPRRPAALSAARNGQPDDLKRIKGIGPKMELLCHSLGFYHLDQIAGWSAEEIAWVDDNLEGFKGRVTRDEWVAQARLLAAGGKTEFSAKVDKGGVY